MLERISRAALVGMVAGAAAGFVVALLPSSLSGGVTVIGGLVAGAVGGFVAGAIERIVESWVEKD